MIIGVHFLHSLHSQYATSEDELTSNINADTKNIGNQNLHTVAYLGLAVEARAVADLEFQKSRS